MGGGLTSLFVTPKSEFEIKEEKWRNLLRPPEFEYKDANGNCLHLCVEKWSDGFHCCDCWSMVTGQQADNEMKILNGIVDNSTPEDGVFRGVTIRFLEDFIRIHKCYNMTTREVRRKFVMPLTRASRCRFVELDFMKDVVGKAETFVSHCWGAKFGDLVSAISDGYADTSRIVWVDIFAVRQWPSEKPDLDFSAVVKQCRSFCIVCSYMEEVEKLKLNPNLNTKDMSMLPAQIRSQIAF